MYKQQTLLPKSDKRVFFRKVCQRGNAKWEISSETTEAFYSLSDKPRQLNYEQT